VVRERRRESKGQREFTLVKLEFAACALITQSLLYDSVDKMAAYITEALLTSALRNKIS
jgi:hypothetical protein